MCTCQSAGLNGSITRSRPYFVAPSKGQVNTGCTCTCTGVDAAVTLTYSSIRDDVIMSVCQKLDILDVLDTAAGLHIHNVCRLPDPAIGSTCCDHIFDLSSYDALAHSSGVATTLSIPPWNW